MKLASAVLLFCVAVSGAHAQEVYRCGSVYAQTPCAQGRLVETDDSRSDAQRAEAARVAAGERRLAFEMRSDRLASEAAVTPTLAGSLSAPKAVAAADRNPKKKKRVSAQPAAHKDFTVKIANARKKRS